MKRRFTDLRCKRCGHPVRPHWDKQNSQTAEVRCLNGHHIGTMWERIFFGQIQWEIAYQGAVA